MGRLEFGGKHGPNSENEFSGGVQNSTMDYSPNNIKRGRFMCMSWRQVVYQSGFTKTLVQPLGLDILLKLTTYQTMPAWLDMSRNTWQKRLSKQIGLKAFIGSASPDNGLTFRLWKVTATNGGLTYLTPLFTTKLIIGTWQDTELSTPEQER